MDIDDDSSASNKRRKVTQACDNCRRKKARCDGRQPCYLCQANGRRCEYSPKGPLSMSEYADALEHKVTQLEELLRGASHRDSQSSRSRPASPAPNDGASDGGVIESVVDAQPSNGDGPSVDTQFGGLSILDRLHRLCGTVSEKHYGHGQSTVTPAETDLSAAFNLAPPEFTPSISWDVYTSLPSRSNIHEAVDIVTSAVCCNLQFLGKPGLTQIMDQVLDTVESGTSQPSHQSMALIFAVLALGKRYGNAQDRQEAPLGVRFFRASRAFLDPSDCQDLTSVKTLMCMALYTQSCSMLSTSHSYICVAIASALHIGIFDQSNDHWSDEDQADARAIADVLFIMDAYITTALGLPRMLRDTKTASLTPELSMPNDTNAPMYGTWCAVNLGSILAETVESLYPPLRLRPKKNNSYGVKRADIDESERKLSRWFEHLNQQSSAFAESKELHGSSAIRSQLLLRLHHSHAELVLYRPFIHHALRTQVGGDENAVRAYACGSACIKASMQVVWLTEKMEALDVFTPALWLVPLIIAFAATCLVLYVRGAPAEIATKEERNAAIVLKNFCKRFARSSTSLQRCASFLEAYFPEEGAHDPNDPSGWREHFDENLSHFQDALAFDHSYEASENELPGVSLPRLQTFLNRSL